MPSRHCPSSLSWQSSFSADSGVLVRRDDGEGDCVIGKAGGMVSPICTSLRRPTLPFALFLERTSAPTWIFSPRGSFFNSPIGRWKGAIAGEITARISKRDY